MTSHEDLKHIIVPIAGLLPTSQVALLDTGAIITAEDLGMLQGLYSRDYRSFLEHLERVAKAGSGKFMKTFYLGYGHKSIADCGSVTLFIDHVSMLAAKAIQDWELYNGQECSTRYLDFSSQPFIDPINTDATKDLLEELRATYLASLEPVRAHLRELYPLQEGDDETTYTKAINARSFDICRCLLPAGAATSLSWHGNLRQLGDKLEWLRHHPLDEVRAIAGAMEIALVQGSPNSFPTKRYAASEQYRAWFMAEEHHAHPCDRPNADWNFRLAHDGIDRSLLERFGRVLIERPAKTEPPKSLAECGNCRFEFALDYGSYRDLQRHRAVHQRMPLLTPMLGFHPWYIEQFPKSVFARVAALTSKVVATYDHLFIHKHYSRYQLQYLIPMGFRVPCSVSGDLAALIYLVELRATSYVHPTLQERAIQIADVLEEQFESYGLKLHIDRNDVGRFSIKRGAQDIVAKS